MFLECIYVCIKYRIRSTSFWTPPGSRNIWRSRQDCSVRQRFVQLDRDDQFDSKIVSSTRSTVQQDSTSGDGERRNLWLLRAIRFPTRITTWRRSVPTSRQVIGRIPTTIRRSTVCSGNRLQSSTTTVWRPTGVRVRRQLESESVWWLKTLFRAPARRLYNSGTFVAWRVVRPIFVDDYDHRVRLNDGGRSYGRVSSTTTVNGRQATAEQALGEIIFLVLAALFRWISIWELVYHSISA